jgi:hypothetical protein
MSPFLLMLTIHSRHSRTHGTHSLHTRPLLRETGFLARCDAVCYALPAGGTYLAGRSEIGICYARIAYTAVAIRVVGVSVVAVG